MARPVITLLTDFGMSDHYAGTVKGVLLSFAPDAQLVDISHEIPAQDLTRGAYELAAAVDYFPRGTVHLAVVDPGVGTTRRAIALRGPRARFVGPDNGLFSHLLVKAGAPRIDDALGIPDGWKARQIDIDRFRLASLSPTFHGRDLFAPVAGRLAAGLPFGEVGKRLDRLVDLAAPLHDSYVIAIDRFGNVITNRRIEANDNVTVAIRGQVIDRLTRTYGEGSGLIALVGSSGFLEIAIPGGNAAEYLRVNVGDPIEAVVGSEPQDDTAGRTAND